MRFTDTWTEASVRATRRVADGVMLFEIEPVDGVRPYTPGSHLQVGLLVNGVPETRHYSLVGEATDGAYRIAVHRRPDGLGGSVYMHGLRPGARLQISHPANHFELSYGASEYLLIAGGIGVTPLVSMASTLRRRGERYRLVYAGRSRGAMAFLDELVTEHGDRVEAYISGEGRRCDLAALFATVADRAEVYLCGPMRLRDAAARAWRASGRPPSQLRFETFASSGMYPSERFTVHVADTGATVEVAENVTMLDAMRAAGVEMMWDCLRGECGLCAVDVLSAEGELDHRDVFFSENERAAGRKICTCVSRAVGGAVTVDSGRRQGAILRL